MIPAQMRGREAGFTLLEVLVAFVIAALALGVLFEGAVGAIRSTRVADRTEQALSRAQSHLATIGHGVPLAALTQEGEDGGGYHWRMRIVPLQSAPIGRTDDPQAARAVLYAVQVTVSWPDEGNDRDADHTRSVTLRTERLGQQRGGGP